MPNPIKTKAKVSNIINHGEDIFTVRLDVPKKATRFKPGQFLHLTLEDFDPASGFWPESRVFSIASPPKRDYLDIIYSVKGEYTARMSKELYVGREVWLKLPYGDFIIENYMEDKDEIVLVAGGTGISPFIPFLLKHDKSNIPITLYYGIRNENLYLFKNLIEELSQNVKVYIKQGVMDIQSISNEIALKENALCCISGPYEMISKFRANLIEKGFDENSIKIDAWE